MDIMQEMSTLRVMLDRAVTESKERGRVLAKCEHDYRVAKAKYILQQRTEGTPVTILSDLAKGGGTHRPSVHGTGHRSNAVRQQQRKRSTATNYRSGSYRNRYRGEWNQA